MTFCPGTPGAILSFDFTSFDLNSGDYLEVFNGDNTLAPSLGLFSGGTPIIAPVVAQLATNPSGCITFVFISDPLELGDGWEADISCSLPCQDFDIFFNSFYPDTNALGFLDFCSGDTALISASGIFFNNDQTYHQSDSNISWYWTVNGDTVNYNSDFEFPADSIGGSFIRVFALDSNACAANYYLNLTSRVATIPEFTGTGFTQDTICFGDTSFMSVNISPVEWSNSVPTGTTPNTHLPDVSGGGSASYDSDINYSQFAPGATVTNVNQINRIWMDVEHSFLGDLIIRVTCPNNSTTVLKGAGGGSRWLGEACDGTLTLPGIGYIYEWQPTGNTNSDLVTHSTACLGCPIVTNPCSGGTSSTLPAGSYDSDQPLSNLVGCPLNGVWTITFVDNASLDDGYLFAWGIDFSNAVLPPNVISYTPGIDSIVISNTSTNPNSSVGTVHRSMDSLAIVPLLDSATYSYTITVLDSFGCAHDSTFSFFVRDKCDPVCYVPQRPVFTINKVTCTGRRDGSIISVPDSNQIPKPWSFVWTDGSGNVVHSNLNTSGNDSLGGLANGIYTVQIIDGNGCQSLWPVNVKSIKPMQVVITGSRKTSCYGVGCDADAMAIVFNGTQPYSFEWSNGDTLAAIQTLCVGAGSLEVSDANGCVDTSSFMVTEPDPISASLSALDDTICVSNTTTLTGSASGGTLPYSFDWGTGFGAVSSEDVSPTSHTSFSVKVSDAHGCPADSAVLTVWVRSPLSVSFSPIDTICPVEELTLTANVIGGDQNYSYAWSGSLGTSASATLIGTASQYFFITVTDGCGSTAIADSIWVQVGGYPAISVDVMEWDTICKGERYYMHANAEGGIGTYTYEWDNGLGFGQFQNDLPTASTVYNVTVTDECLTTPGIGTINLEFGDFYGYELLVDTNQNCDPATFQFAWDTLNIDFEYFLDFGEGFDPVNGLDTLYKDLDDNGCFDVTAKIITKHGCVSSKNYPCLVSVLPRPIADFDFDSHSPDVIESYVDFWDESTGADVWKWYSNGNLIDSSEKFSKQFPAEGTFNIKLVVANEFGCLDSTDTDLEVFEVTTYYFPSAFTPNGDGNNDVFKMVGKGVKKEDFELTIYDRWGGIVYQGQSRDEGWNGRALNEGEELPIGLYTYYYSLRLHTGRKYGATGKVNLLR